MKEGMEGSKQCEVKGNYKKKNAWRRRTRRGDTKKEREASEGMGER